MEAIERHLPESLALTGQDAYLVGGAVRDLLLGAVPEDMDIAVLDDPRLFASQLATRVGGRRITLGRPGFEIERVVAQNTHYDVCEVNGSNIFDDLMRRDFTINAIAWDLSHRKLIDPCNGMADLTRGQVRMVSQEGFKQDPIRLLRAFRLAAAFNFSLEPDTLAAVKRLASDIQSSAGERVRVELLKLLAASQSAPYIETMAASGLLDAVFPELAATRNCLQNRHHSFDVFTHTLVAYRHLEKILQSPADFFPDQTRWIQRGIDSADRPLLKLAMLLHDIGKPPTRSVSDAGKTTFYGHPGKGAQMAKDVNHRLRLSKREAEQIEMVVAHHLRPLHLFQSQGENNLSEKAIFRFFRTTGRLTPHVLVHTAADCMGKEDSPESVDSPLMTFLSTLLECFSTRYTKNQSKKRLLNGHDIMKHFGLKPSPLIGRILARVEEAEFAGQVRSREAALALIDERFQRDFSSRSLPQVEDKSPESD